VDPKLAEVQPHRYNAARAAAHSGAGQGSDAPGDEAGRAALRRQALVWLRADLALRAQRLENGSPAQRTAVAQAMRRWLNDPDLAGIRQTQALAPLPAAEGAEWHRLWADVAALLRKAEDKAK
jgi:hypothetical protein